MLTKAEIDAMKDRAEKAVEFSRVTGYLPTNYYNSHADAVALLSHLSELEAQMKVKDEVIRKAHRRIEVNNSDSELNWLDDVREILFGALTTPAADTKEKI